MSKDQGFKHDAIRNKYDVFNVKGQMDDFIKYHFDKTLKIKENEMPENIQMGLGLVASALILLSYFHKTTFPFDKWTIIICTFCYLAVTYAMEFILQKQRMGYDIGFVLGDQGVRHMKRVVRPVRKGLLKNGKEETTILEERLDNQEMMVATQAEEFSNEILISMALKENCKPKLGVNVELKIKYNQYLTEDGMLCQEKLAGKLDHLVKMLLRKAISG